jgi:hypothetical protein
LITDHPTKKSFAYHAQALGLSASLTRPCCETIPSLATASLSATGGESYSTVKDYNWKGLISFDEASAYATGSKGAPFEDKRGLHDTYATLSTVTVKNLNVANMVHAGLIVARVSSKHIAGYPEAQISLAGSTIQNLVVRGRQVKVELDETPFAECLTYTGFADMFARHRKTTETNFFRDDKTNVISCSLAKHVEGERDFYISIPEFGTIYIAQVIVRPSYRRISMLRFELGCPIAGAMEAGGGESNGVEYWP